MEKDSAIQSFTTQSFIGNPIGSIAMGTVAGMSLMFLFISIGAPIWLSVGGLIGGILIVFGFKIGKVRYELHEDGVRMIQQNWFSSAANRTPKVVEIKWFEIKSFSNDVDMQRDLKEYEYLKLFITKAPWEVWITDQHNRSGFEQFRDEFLKAVKVSNTATVKEEEALKKSVKEVVAGTEETGSKYLGKTMISEKPGFYKRPMAKVITLFFIFLCGGLFYWGYMHGMREQNWLRVAFIMVPGTAYLVYRVYMKAK
ncbi:hypothetical protein GYB22_00895 [bacterium]|nr:hypothetical protein [bacterium]